VRGRPLRASPCYRHPGSARTATRCHPSLVVNTYPAVSGTRCDPPARRGRGLVLPAWNAQNRCSITSEQNGKVPHGHPQGSILVAECSGHPAPPPYTCMHTHEGRPHQPSQLHSVARPQRGTPDKADSYSTDLALAPVVFSFVVAEGSHTPTLPARRYRIPPNRRAQQGLPARGTARSKQMFPITSEQNGKVPCKNDFCA
jgi:hypothetical protein